MIVEYQNMVGQHPDQGMTDSDIAATLRVARQRNEIIIFRDTGAWSRPYIAAGHPTKPFHVKGKSSDWGPHAGLVPFNSEFSKAFDAEAIKKGRKLNEEGIAGGYASQVPLFLTDDFIRTNLLKKVGSRGNKPINDIVDHGKDLQLYVCTKPNDDPAKPGKPYTLLGKKQLDGRWQIFTPPMDLVNGRAYNVYLREKEALPLMVLTVPTGNGLPITGDYDLFAICPSHGQLGAKDMKMDPTLDNRAQNASFKRTLARASGQMPNPLTDPKGAAEWRRANRSVQSIEAAKTPEDPHRGNLTPRIREAIGSLVAAMGGAHPRVHHNAESGRPFAPGAGDGMPLTVFHPKRGIGGLPFETGIITNAAMLKDYFTAIYEGGYYPPRNPAWDMAWVKDRSAAQAAFRSKFG